MKLYVFNLVQLFYIKNNVIIAHQKNKYPKNTNL